MGNSPKDHPTPTGGDFDRAVRVAIDIATGHEHDHDANLWGNDVAHATFLGVALFVVLFAAAVLLLIR